MTPTAAPAINEPRPRRMTTRLFVIERKSGDEWQYWARSSEHGTGWHGHCPKQAFSPSEVTREVRYLIDQDWWTDCTIRELAFRYQA